MKSFEVAFTVVFWENVTLVSCVDRVFYQEDAHQQNAQNGEHGWRSFFGGVFTEQEVTWNSLEVSEHTIMAYSQFVVWPRQKRNKNSLCCNLLVKS